MNIIDYGSYISNGKYTLHSSFQNVHNYLNNQELISLVMPSVGRGPNNIVLSRIPKKPLNNIIINSTGIQLENYEISLKHCNLKEELALYDFDPLLLSAKIQLIISELSTSVATNSLAFLLYPELENNFKTSFEKAFLKHVNIAVDDFSLNNLPVVASKMKGLGFGLTPSGDDFNCGMLYGLNYLSKILEIDYSETIEKVYRNALGKNLISNTFLKFATLNQYYEKLYNLLKALNSGSDEEIINKAIKVTQAGHSSGSDMLTGFLLTLKRVLYEKIST